VNFQLLQAKAARRVQKLTPGETWEFAED
jgi:hypothetical protein